ncbi:L-histidine 2-aminobutanoyltransferase, partial [Gonapodya sp. JEL0774]
TDYADSITVEGQEVPGEGVVPLPTSDAVHIPAILRQLEATDLHPSPLVNSLFSRLVATALGIESDPAESVSHEQLSASYALCSEGETYMEHHWARRIILEPRSVVDFPYLDNYRQLAAGEYAAVCETLGAAPRRVAFVGSGPLPLTALEWFGLDHELEIVCLDRDEDALHVGRAVAEAMFGKSDRLKFEVADALRADYVDFDVVVVAALVGLDAEAKGQVLNAVAGKVRGDALVAARSVPKDGRKWLYPRLEHDQVPDVLRVVGEWVPPVGVINSLLLMRIRYSQQ